MQILFNRYSPCSIKMNENKLLDNIPYAFLFGCYWFISWVYKLIFPCLATNRTLHSASSCFGLNFICRLFMVVIKCFMDNYITTFELNMYFWLNRKLKLLTTDIDILKNPNIFICFSYSCSSRYKVDKNLITTDIYQRHAQQLNY